MSSARAVIPDSRNGNRVCSIRAIFLKYANCGADAFHVGSPEVIASQTARSPCHFFSDSLVARVTEMNFLQMAITDLEDSTSSLEIALPASTYF